MSLNDVNIWAFVLPLALSALSALLPSQRFVGMLQEESYDTKSYLKKINADKPYHRLRMIFWIVSMVIQFMIYTFLIISSMFADIPRSIYHVIEFETIVATSITSSILWFLLLKRKMPSRPPERNARTVRLNLLLGIIFIITPMIFVLLFVLLQFGSDSLAHTAYKYPVTISIYQFTVTFMLLNSSLGLAPLLLALTANILKPLETILEKRKIYASGDEMV